VLDDALTDPLIAPYPPFFNIFANAAACTNHYLHRSLGMCSNDLDARSEQGGCFAIDAFKFNTRAMPSARFKFCLPVQDHHQGARRRCRPFPQHRLLGSSSWGRHCSRSSRWSCTDFRSSGHCSDSGGVGYNTSRTRMVHERRPQTSGSGSKCVGPEIGRRPFIFTQMPCTTQ